MRSKYLHPSFSSQPEPEVVQESQQQAEAEVETKQTDAELAADISVTTTSKTRSERTASTVGAVRQSNIYPAVLESNSQEIFT